MMSEGFCMDTLPQETVLKSLPKNESLVVDSRNMKMTAHKMVMKPLPRARNLNIAGISVDEGSKLLEAITETPRSTTDLITPAHTHREFWPATPESLPVGEETTTVADVDTPFVTAKVTGAKSSDCNKALPKRAGVQRDDRSSPKAAMLSAPQCHSYSSFWGTAKPLDPFKGGNGSEPHTDKPVVNYFMFMKHC
jgi:hypothetical protein